VNDQPERQPDEQPDERPDEQPDDREHTLRLDEPVRETAASPQMAPTAPQQSAVQESAVQESAPQQSAPQSAYPPPSAAPQSAYPPPQGPAPYPYSYPMTPAPTPKPDKGRVSGWIWPAVAALALVLGSVGGALGGAAYVSWNDDNAGPGRSSGGLAEVDTVSKAPLPADNGSVAAVAENVLPSTVQILADFEGENLGATGSGFVLDKQGHIVTNNHVVEDAAKKDGKIVVVDHEGKRSEADVVGRSPVYDLAVLFVEDLKNSTPAALGTSVDLRIGEGVVAIGSPLGLSSTVTSGIVSALNRPVSTRGDTDDISSFINAVQTDAAINPGNSGGPLVDLRGRVVGVNSAIATTGGNAEGDAGNIGVGFAIPIEQVRVTADQILRDGKAFYPVIGATVNSDGSGDGAHIEGVEKDSPAQQAGLKKGDVVTELNGRRVHDSPMLIVAIRSYLPGDKVVLTVTRDGKQKKYTITLDSKVG